LGSGSKKAHESFSVAPTLAGAGGPPTHGVAAAQAPATTVSPADVQAKEAFWAKLTTVEHCALAGSDPVDGYAALQKAAAEAEALCFAVTHQLDPSEKEPLHQALVKGCAAPLQKAPAPWLQAAALSQGFQHPTLVGLTPNSEHPLAFWLNPTYLSGSPAKAAIQAKAIERWKDIASGSTAYGITLAELQAAEEALAKPAVPAPAAATASPPPPSSSPPTKAAEAPSQRTFLAKQKAVEAALAHYSASISAIPARRSDAEVEALALTPVAAPSVGGMHAKSFHQAPDGSQWMFKPDSRAKGAAAHAEAVASLVCSTGGTPTMPVYVRSMGGSTGSLQPLVAGASPLSSDMKALSQHDVDAVVRSHVSAWLVGDHDCKPDNVLRTPGGGLVPIDHGQAFKFYGSDQLSLDYDPNNAHNHDRTLYQKLYSAHLKGKLAKGVRVRPEAALGVIKRYEAISDSEYRAMLAPVAREGVSQKVPWYPAMVQRAKATKGGPPTATDVATAFLDCAVERKQQLRAGFTAFFAQVFAPKTASSTEAVA
jgi:hypothetical protein